jgi:DNA-binding Lrp family transcriptional regulator
MRKSSGIKKEINKAVDELDIIIIKRLLENSRMSFAEIAEECKVSTLTIRNRYSRLKKTGIIRGSTVIATEEDFHGVEGIVDSGITVNKQDIDRFVKYVNDIFQNKKNYWAFPVHFNEKYNVSVTVLARSIREIQEIKDALMQHPAVINISLAIWTAIRNIPQNLDPEPFR